MLTARPASLRAALSPGIERSLFARVRVCWFKLSRDGFAASELAANIIPLTYHKYADNGANVALQKAFVEANASIHERGQQNRDFQGMGTTGTALLLRLEGAWIGHVGDSRCITYPCDQILRRRHLSQL